MLIATSFTVALLTASPLGAHPLITTRPIVVKVIAAPDISPSLVKSVLTEAGDIWRAAGFEFVWEGGSASRPSRSSGETLRVIIGHARGTALGDEAVALGWIVFDDFSTPSQEIYVSYANATQLMALSRGIGVIDHVDRMPRAERETLLGRVMGRALAHELGHYLLASKAHSSAGLMRARRTAAEFFSTSRDRFQVEAQQRATIAARLAPILIASRESSTAGRPSPVPAAMSSDAGRP